MKKNVFLGAALVAIGAIVMAPSTSAACNPAKSASTYSAAGTAYWHTTLPESSSIVGQTWQLGAPGSWSTGNCADFLYFSAGGLNLNLNLGGCGNGCPATGSTLAVLAQVSSPLATEFLLATVTETPAANVNFDYGAQGDHNLVPLPRPRVTSSSRAGGTVNLQLSLPPVTAGLYGPNAASAITGYRVLSVSSPTNPGRNAAAYTSTLATIPAAGGTAATASVGVDCSNIANDQWVVTQINFENGAVLGGAVSEATQVKCNPALADPKFKIVPKKGAPVGRQ